MIVDEKGNVSAPPIRSIIQLQSRMRGRNTRKTLMAIQVENEKEAIPDMNQEDALLSNKTNRTNKTKTKRSTKKKTKST